MSQPTFAKPSEAPSGGGIAPLEGALCIFTFRSRGTAMTEFSKPGEDPKAYVEVDVDVVAGPAAGAMSTPTKVGRQPEPLTAKAGDHFEGMRLFQGWLRGCFNGQQPGGMVLGIPYVSWEKTNSSGNDLAPVWKFQDATPDQEGWAVQYLQAKAARSMTAPSAAAAPAGPAAPQGYAPPAPSIPVPQAVPAPPAQGFAPPPPPVAAQAPAAPAPQYAPPAF